MSRRISRRVPPSEKPRQPAGVTTDAAAGIPLTLEQQLDEQLWEVTDSAGRHHGTFARDVASDVLDRIWLDNPSLGWVAMTETGAAPETTH